MDNYVTGYPVLICATLEAIALGWIYGVERLKRDLKLMSGKYPNMYWIACFLVLTPLFTFVSLSTYLLLALILLWIDNFYLLKINRECLSILNSSV